MWHNVPLHICYSNRDAMSHDCNWASWYREYIYQNEVDFGWEMALN